MKPASGKLIWGSETEIQRWAVFDRDRWEVFSFADTDPNAARLCGEMVSLLNQFYDRGLSTAAREVSSGRYGSYDEWREAQYDI